MDTNNQLLALGRRTLADQAFSGLLGTQMVRLEPGQVELRLDLRPELLQQGGFVHGGVLGYLADNAAAFAGGSLLGSSVVTAEYKISFLRPASGIALHAHGLVVHASRSQAVCRCEIFVADNGDGRRLCAVALATIARIASQPS